MTEFWDKPAEKSGKVLAAFLEGLPLYLTAVPEFIDPVLGMKMIVFAKISLNRSFSIQFVPRDLGLSLFWKSCGVLKKEPHDNSRNYNT
jgi:hypothetical protein